MVSPKRQHDFARTRRQVAPRRWRVEQRNGGGATSVLANLTPYGNANTDADPITTAKPSFALSDYIVDHVWSIEEIVGLLG
jgi:hypothetical protein